MSETVKLSDRAVCIDYTNYRGERSRRHIEPESIWFGSNEWHKEPQWLLVAYDLDKRAYREFALAGVHEWPMPALAPLQTQGSNDG